MYTCEYFLLRKSIFVHFIYFSTTHSVCSSSPFAFISPINITHPCLKTRWTNIPSFLKFWVYLIQNYTMYNRNIIHFANISPASWHLGEKTILTEDWKEYLISHKYINRLFRSVSLINSFCIFCIYICCFSAINLQTAFHTFSMGRFFAILLSTKNK